MSVYRDLGVSADTKRLVASQCRREEHGGRFLGLMAYLEPKGEEDSVRSRTGQGH